MRRWPRRVFDPGIDLGSGHGSPTEVDYGCKDSLGQRGFMQSLLKQAEEIRSEGPSGFCTGSLDSAFSRYYSFRLAEAEISPKTMTPWPESTGLANWKSFEVEDDSGAAVHFRRWSEESHYNQNAYTRFIAEFDKAAAD